MTSLSLIRRKKIMLIVEKLKLLVASERKITAEIIEHIQEIDQKKIYAQMGYPTLFAFLTEYIGYAAASAQRRIEAARLLTAVPEVKEDIKSGNLNLSQVAMVSQMIRQKQKEKPEVKIGSDDKKTLLFSIKNQNFESSQKIISQTLDLDIKQFDKKVIQKDESVRLEITFSKEQMKVFNRVKELLSHINPSASTAEIIEYLANDYLNRKDPMKKPTITKSKNVIVNDTRKTNQKTVSASETDARHGATIKDEGGNTICKSEAGLQAINKEENISRRTNPIKRLTIPAATRRFVWQRDQGQCQHLNVSSGKKCGSSFLIEIDHIKRIRHGGSNHPKNLQLLCHSHNHLRG
jgi:hypothetical protein